MWNHIINIKMLFICGYRGSFFTSVGVVGGVGHWRTEAQSHLFARRQVYQAWCKEPSNHPKSSMTLVKAMESLIALGKAMGLACTHGYLPFWNQTIWSNWFSLICLSLDWLGSQFMLPENLDIGVSRLDIAKLEVSEQKTAIWVCLKMGYIPLMILFFLETMMIGMPLPTFCGTTWWLMWVKQ